MIRARERNLWKLGERGRRCRRIKPHGHKNENLSFWWHLRLG